MVLLENISSSLNNKKINKFHQPRSVCIGKNCTLCLQYRYSRPWAYILRSVKFKRICVHSLTSVNTSCNLWQGKIPVRLSQSQRARQKLWNVQFRSLFFSTAGDAKKNNFRVIIFFETYVPDFFLRALCSTTNARLNVHSSLTRTS